MNENSKQILLWGIKILSERYWNQEFKLSFDTSVIKHTLELMPQSDKLINQLEKGYFTSDEQELFALRSIFSNIQLSEWDQSISPFYLHPIFNFVDLNLPVEESVINKVVFENVAIDFSKYSLKTESEQLLNILQKYGGFLPIFNQPDCTMPLFEYVKIASALAAKDPIGDFRLVIGDLSGIQNFIYTISSEKALKVLRARSFYLELLMKALAYEICDDLGLTSANIFYAGGGNFLLLLPEQDDLDDRLEEYYKAINMHFLNQFQGNLHIPFATMKLTKAELKDKASYIIQNKWNILFEKVLAKAKNKKFQPYVKSITNKKLIDDNLGKPIDVPGHKCLLCHADKDNSDLGSDRQCKFCEKLNEVGERLHKGKQEFEVPQLKPISTQSFLNEPNWPFSSNEKNAKRIFSINSISDNKNPLLLFCNYVTLKKDGKTADFEDLASKAIGARRIATLSMDVDNMSSVFRNGFQTEDPRQFLVLAPTLSRLMDYFFKIGLTNICKRPTFHLLNDNGNLKKQRPRNVSVIYSGGDDLLLAGAWNDVAEVAIEIQEKFHQFVCYNPDFGISGGMYVSNYNFPFYVAVNKAKQAEKNVAKRNFIRTNGRLKKKNSVVLFYDELTNFRAQQLKNYSMKKRYLFATTWDEVHTQVLSALKLFLAPEICSIKNGKVEAKFSHRFIGKLHEINHKFLTHREGHIYIPDLVYHFSRLESDVRDKLLPIYEKYVNYHEKRIDNPIRYLPVVLNWLELLLREKGE